MRVVATRCCGENKVAELITLKSLQEAADLLGVSIFTIRRLINAGEIRAVNVGARRLVPATEIERVASHGAGVGRMHKPRSGAEEK
jgi:excisionase family DNA binding protein